MEKKDKTAEEILAEIGEPDPVKDAEGNVISDYPEFMPEGYVKREWTEVKHQEVENGLKLKILHWNMLAHRLADNFDNVPMKLQQNFPLRLTLMKDHFKKVDPDIISLSEVDCVSFRTTKQYAMLMKAMADMGYLHIYNEKANGLSAQAVFWKKSKFEMLSSGYSRFVRDESQYFIWTKLQTKSKDGSLPEQQFIFAECHLKAKPKNMSARIRQTAAIRDYCRNNWEDLPVIFAGDFNEEPQNEPMTTMREAFVDFYSLALRQEG